MKILIIDDDRDFAESLKIILGKHNFEVHVAYDYEEAMVQFATMHHEIVLVDVYLGRESGFDLIKGLKKRIPNSIFIIMSGFPNTEDSDKAYEVGAITYLTKPIKINRLIELVKTCRLIHKPVT